jgi:hypothetical protein
MAQVQVLAIITANPGMRAQMLDAYRDNVAVVRAEDGCIAYEAVVDVQGEYFRSGREMGVDGGVEVSRRGAAHEGICREDQGMDGSEGHPRSRSGLRSAAPGCRSFHHSGNCNEIRRILALRSFSHVKGWRRPSSSEDLFTACNPTEDGLMCQSEIHNSLRGVQTM